MCVQRLSWRFWDSNVSCADTSVLRETALLMKAMLFQAVTKPQLSWHSSHKLSMSFLLGWVYKLGMFTVQAAVVMSVWQWRADERVIFDTYDTKISSRQARLSLVVIGS